MKINKLHPLIFVIGSLIASLCLADKQPNLIVYMIDDLGWNQISATQVTMGTHTGSFITPNIEKIANQGLSFTHAYTQPNSPSRAAMLSGQYPARINNGVYVVGNLNRNKKPGITKEKAQFTGPTQTQDVATHAVTIAEALKKMGTTPLILGNIMWEGIPANQPCPRIKVSISTSEAIRRDINPHVLPRTERMVGSSQNLEEATSTALVSPTQNPM